MRCRPPCQYRMRGSSKRVAEVDEQVDQHVGGREHQDDALDDRIVAAQDRIDGQPADAGDREHRLGDDDAADQQRDADADDRHDRHRGVLQRVADQHLVVRRDPWPARCGCSPAPARRACWRASCGRSARHRPVPSARLGRIRCATGTATKPSRDADIALHRQQIELDREDVDQQVGEHEDRHRETRAPRRPSPRGRSTMPAFHAASTPSGIADERSRRSASQSVSATVGSTRCAISLDDRQVGEDRDAEIAVQQRPHPGRRTG